MAEAALVQVKAAEIARLDPQALINRALDVGASVDTIERLMALAKDMRAVTAREAWYEAMAAFQRTCPPIKKTSSAKIQTRSGPGYSYRFASLDEIMATVTPVLTDLGLSVSWKSAIKANGVVVSCRVAHALGHVEDGGEVEMPIVSGDTGANPAQRVGIALTYARRYALMNALGIAPEDDDDAGSADVRHRDERPSAPATRPEPVERREPGTEEGAPAPSYEPFGAVTMASRMFGAVDKLPYYFGTGRMTKTALDKLKTENPEAFRAGYDKLHAEYLAWRDQQP